MAIHIEQQLKMIDAQKQIDNFEAMDWCIEVLAEVTRAETIHPYWPEDVVKAVSIMAEEAGEAIRAANDFDAGRLSEGGSEAMANLKEELVQTAAMCLRCLKNLPDG